MAKRDGINQKTVAKWKGRTSVADVPTGPKDATSTVLSIEEDAIASANDRPSIPEPLLSIMIVVDVPKPTQDQARLIVAAIAAVGYAVYDRREAIGIVDICNALQLMKRWERMPVGFLR